MPGPAQARSEAPAKTQNLLLKEMPLSSTSPAVRSQGKLPDLPARCHFGGINPPISDPKRGVKLVSFGVINPLISDPKSGG